MPHPNLTRPFWRSPFYGILLMSLLKRGTMSTLNPFRPDRAFLPRRHSGKLPVIRLFVLSDPPQVENYPGWNRWTFFEGLSSMDLFRLRMQCLIRFFPLGRLSPELSQQSRAHFLSCLVSRLNIDRPLNHRHIRGIGPLNLCLRLEQLSIYFPHSCSFWSFE